MIRLPSVSAAPFGWCVFEIQYRGHKNYTVSYVQHMPDFFPGNYVISRSSGCKQELDVCCPYSSFSSVIPFYKAAHTSSLPVPRSISSLALPGYLHWMGHHYAPDFFVAAPCCGQNPRPLKGHNDKGKTIDAGAFTPRSDLIVRYGTAISISDPRMLHGAYYMLYLHVF